MTLLKYSYKNRPSYIGKLIPILSVAFACLFPLYLFAMEQSKAPSLNIEMPTSIVSPGTILEISLIARYPDLTSIQYHLDQTETWPFETISKQVLMPIWQFDHWQQEVKLQLVSSVAGEYELPQFVAHASSQNEVTKLVIAPVPFKVISNFAQGNKPQLQDLSPMPVKQLPEQSYHFSAALIVLISLLLFAFKFRLQKFPPWLERKSK